MSNGRARDGELREQRNSVIFCVFRLVTNYFAFE
jgi:hypothetical protein